MSFESFRGWANKWLGIVTGIIAILAALFAGIRYIVNSEVSGMRSDLQHLTDDVKPLPEGVSSLRERIAKLEIRIDIKDAAAHPESPQHAKAAENALSNAQNAKLTLDPEVIKDAGDALLNVGQENSEAWRTGLKFVEYRTWINSEIVPFSTKPAKYSPYLYGLALKPNPMAKRDPTVAAVQIMELPGRSLLRIQPVLSAYINLNRKEAGFAICSSRAELTLSY